MDISTIKPGDMELDIEHPSTGEFTGLRIHLISTDDDRLKKVQRKWTNLALAASRQRRKNKLTAEQVEERGLELLATAMVKLEWLEGDDGKRASFNGEQPEASKEANLELLEQDWLRRQVDEALGDTAGFFESSESD